VQGARQDARPRDLLAARPISLTDHALHRFRSVSGSAELATGPSRPLSRVEPTRIAAVRSAARPAPVSHAPAGLIDADLVEQTLTACLTLLAQTAAETGQAERALRLRGAVCALRGQANASDWPSADACERSDRPAASPAPEYRSRLSTPAIPLTDRQREVAGLIRQGMTNREIADTLVIAERTADTHVQNILNKLGVVSRAQIAAWVVEQGIAPSREIARS
jgi:DNA-binding CsgD family transcriptional regulator